MNKEDLSLPLLCNYFRAFLQNKREASNLTNLSNICLKDLNLIQNSSLGHGITIVTYTEILTYF